MSIRFTQFIRPDGRAVPIEIDRSTDVEARYRYLAGLGCKFESEVLTSGMVSFEILRGEDLVTNAICSNGPGLECVVDGLIDKAYARLGGI